MKIEIEKKPVTKANLNLIGFKEQLTKEWNIKKAVLNNLKITHRTPNSLEEEGSKKLMFFGTDWGSFLQMFEVSQPKTVEFMIYKTEIKGLTVYTPNAIDTTTGVVDMQDGMVDTTDFMVTNSLSKRIDSNIETMISKKLIDYIDHDWNVIIDMEKEV